MATRTQLLSWLVLFACVAGGLTLIVLGFVGSEDKFNVGMLGGGVALIVVPIIGYVCFQNAYLDDEDSGGGAADANAGSISCGAPYAPSSQGGNVVSALHIVKYGRV